MSSQATLSLEHEVAQNCQSVSVDITAAGFPSNVAGSQLFLEFNSDVLYYTSITPGTMNFFVNQYEPGKLAMIWPGNPFGQAINGVIATLNFDYAAGYTDVIFDTDQCVFDDSDLQPITVIYVDGSVSPVPADTVYVDAAVGSSGDGQSWATALKTIGEATALTLEPGDRVLVKPGTYAESVTIKSNGTEFVPAASGVVLSDTNKVQFPTNTELWCANPTANPGELYVYIYRSRKSNNGYYKILSVDDDQDFVIVEGASFHPETGVSGDNSRVMAAIGRPVVFMKDPASSDVQRVKIDISGVGGATHGIYVGDPIGGGATDANPADFNIIDGFDITGGSSAKGLHIQSSAHNVFTNGQVYENNGPGIYINGNNIRTAEFNIIHGNKVYNTPDQGVFVGYGTAAANNNHAHFNHILDNEIYQSGLGSLAKFDNAILVSSRNHSCVVEGNQIRNITVNTTDNGAVMIGSRTHNTLIYDNLIRNVEKVGIGNFACVMIADSIDSLLVVNNIIKRELFSSNQVFAFRINGTLHVNSRILFNTISEIAKGFYLEDLGASVDVKIQNNIVQSATPYFQNVGTSGRFSFSYNNWPTLPPAPYGGGTGDVIGDPLFISPATESAGGLRPSLLSPCLGAGTSISDISCDYLGVTRSSPPTMGAFQEALINCIWTGVKGDDWDDYGNWDCEVVPTLQLNVFIPATSTDPVIYKGNASCKSLEVQTGADLEIQPPYELQIGN